MITISSLLAATAVSGAGLKLATAKWKMALRKPADTKVDDLPTVSVCIPARNETHAMTTCLESVLASDYPKLEVIVLDDSSSDNTSLLIKSFAHAGVRFVEGSPLEDGWLGKNFALQGLLKEASGDLVMFMDVDTVIGHQTIGNIASHMTANQLKMTSVIPRRRDGPRASVLFGNLRYLRVLLFGSRRQPAVSSSLWCVERHFLQTNGGIEKFKAAVQPEIHIAASIADNKFQCLIDNQDFRVGFEKKWSSQVETSIRLLAPASGGGIFSALWLLALTALTAAVLALPIGIISGDPLLSFSGGLYLAAMTFLFGVYFTIIWRPAWWLVIGLVIWPALLIQETVLLAVSMLQYARGRVSWKGRLIANGKISSLVSPPAEKN